MRRYLSVFALLAVSVFLLSFPVQAADGTAMLQQVYDNIDAAARTWVAPLRQFSEKMFWYLVLISLVWTFATHLFAGTLNFSALFLEFIRFSCFVGFWLWSLRFGWVFIHDIVATFYKLGVGSTGSGRVDAGSLLWKALDITAKIFEASENLNFADKVLFLLIGIVMGAIVAVVCANLLVMMCAGLILCYGGIFYFGFGGSRWTSDIAVNFYKSVLGIGINIYGTLLLINMCSEVFVKFAADMAAQNEWKFQNIIAMGCAALVMGCVVMKVPPMLAGIVQSPTGSIGGAGVGAAMNTVQSMTSGLMQKASNAAAAISSAREKMMQNASMGTGLVAGAGAASGLMRGLETAKILSGAMFQSWREGGPKGGVSRMIDNAFQRDEGKAEQKQIAAQSANDPKNSYVSSVPADAGGSAGGSGANAGGSGASGGSPASSGSSGASGGGFAGGSIGGAVKEA